MANILVDSDKNLINLLSKIEEHTEIGLDTEFIRESTYRPILALMQIALPNNEIYIIDPVKITKKNIINKFLTNPKIIKIIHSSKQDLEALYSYTQVFPVNIFDLRSHLTFYLRNLMLLIQLLLKLSVMWILKRVRGEQIG